ncbi:unnamed protein product [Didymodactylos carnosus]|uniref:Alpha/beta hydrolase n=1 Tax=Didymodactylos carnosus TaxID=1234261 RepID=A0A814PL59_9BILA|nr:unnamed protein product [Didymodactylos carnosus]CAF3872168.1 unnamed protein product [Didymodactylos carnosus]
MFDSYKEFADRNYCALFIPLFPEGYSYQKLIDSSTNRRYDLLLLDMIDEITIKNTNIDTRKFLLHGYSAGGQFVHRFAYLHANRLLALSVGAPGSITLIDESRAWPSGTKDLSTIFGDVDVQTLKTLPIQICVGARDHRLKTAERLERNFVQEIGLKKVKFDIVSDAGHDSSKMKYVVSEFFQKVLNNNL